MKTKSLYVCEICGTSYVDKNKCLECEKSHKKVKAIKSEKYLAISNDATGYPISLEVEMADGTIKKYRRG